MNGRWWRSAALFALALSAVWATRASAQTSEVKEKPRMYSYVAFWALPRAQWANEAKLEMDDRKILDKSLADGKLIGYGDDTVLVHQPDGATHDDWFSSMSLAGLLDVLDQFYKSPDITSPVEASATKHWDSILVTRFYNWHAGSWKDAYTYVASYKFKPDAPEDGLETLCKGAIVPIMEKLLADGTILEYEVDTEAIHTDAPGTFYIAYLAPNAESLDKVGAAIRESFKSNPLHGPAFDSMLDYSSHRDYLVRTNATYK